jgi:hypothetical protein
MAGRVKRGIVFAAALTLSGGLGAPSAAGAQGSEPLQEASCTRFSQALLTQAYGDSAWQVAAIEQRASAAFQQATTSSQLAALFTQYGNELGALQEQQAPSASISTESSADGPATLCTYQANGVFQRGTGTVGLVLVLSGADWQVLRVRLHDVEHPAAS